MSEHDKPKLTDECRCPCHRNAAVMHFVNCCVFCTRCGLNIIRTRFDGHYCQPQPVNTPVLQEVETEH